MKMYDFSFQLSKLVGMALLCAIVIELGILVSYNGRMTKVFADGRKHYFEVEEGLIW